MGYYGIEDIRIDHKLDKNSIVFEVGGHIGNFSNAIIQEFDSYVYIFEPIKKFYKILNTKYDNNKKVKIFNYGLEAFNDIRSIGNIDEGSSIYTNSFNTEMVEFKNINDVINELNLEKIDLMELNCEGSEYAILKEISESNISKISRLQIQFHKVESIDYVSAKNECIDKLKMTHNKLWNYETHFECWQLLNL